MGKASRDKRDVYYRLAKEEGWRSRSAFKLLQLQEQFHLFQGVQTVVDLCAAPGGWSQVLCQKLYKSSDDCKMSSAKVVAVDIQQMAPYPHLEIIQGDITKMETVKQIFEKFDGNRVDLVVCDGAPDGGGSFVAKLFRGKHNSVILDRLRENFADVSVAKPRCSRNSSVEAFVVCTNFLPDHSQLASLNNLLFRNQDKNLTAAITIRCKTPFVACGSSSNDSDRTYPKQLGGEEYVMREPTQSPIAPPYEESIKLLSNKVSYLSIAHEEPGVS